MSLLAQSNNTEINMSAYHQFQHGNSLCFVAVEEINNTTFSSCGKFVSNLNDIPYKTVGFSNNGMRLSFLSTTVIQEL